MFLVDCEIRHLAKDQNLIVPYEEECLNAVSYDVRVGGTAKLRILNGWLDIDLRNTTKNYPYFIYPNDRVLVSSLEVFNFPNNIVGQFKLKSSRGREFYQHINSGWCEPGWNGSTLTMQILSMDVSPLPLYFGMRIGQMIFSRLEVTPELSYAERGRYNGDKDARESKD